MTTRTFLLIVLMFSCAVTPNVSDPLDHVVLSYDVVELPGWRMTDQQWVDFHAGAAVWTSIGVDVVFCESGDDCVDSDYHAHVIYGRDRVLCGLRLAWGCTWKNKLRVKHVEMRGGVEGCKLRGLVAHEFGHVLGAGHLKDWQEGIMSERKLPCRLTRADVELVKTW